MGEQSGLGQESHMVQPANSSASLALSRRPRNSRGPWAAPRKHNDTRVGAKTVIGRGTLTAASAIPRPVTPAEVAQARVFERLLQAESAELHELAHRIPAAAERQIDNDSSASSWDLVQIRARIDEVQRLLDALQGRFPQLPGAER
jgi:hypothetical protein